MKTNVQKPPVSTVVSSLSRLLYISLTVGLLLGLGYQGLQYIETSKLQTKYNHLIKEYQVIKDSKKGRLAEDESKNKSPNHLDQSQREELMCGLQSQLAELEIKMITQTQNRTSWEVLTPTFSLQDWSPLLVLSHPLNEISSLHLQERVSQLVYGPQVSY